MALSPVGWFLFGLLRASIGRFGRAEVGACVRRVCRAHLPAGWERALFHIKRNIVLYASSRNLGIFIPLIWNSLMRIFGSKKNGMVCVPCRNRVFLFPDEWEWGRAPLLGPGGLEGL
ncbi:hypothetical protein [Allofranklinella schreckenbergeri]|uniref:hypothetical protein n=1 Tax=Allofranklinella schreckenbergeri TaxID=1076744 RepID=UPI0011C47AA0|nr:hypothetical protein [Allofranklinella schreckenbergeri]